MKRGERERKAVKEKVGKEKCTAAAIIKKKSLLHSQVSQHF